MLRNEARQNSRSTVIQTWPVLGYWDFVISRLILRHLSLLIVLHDPHPLVYAKGYGRMARWMASRSVVAATPIVHSSLAADVVRAHTGLPDIIQLPHPMFPPEKRRTRSDNKVIIRVLGQYKADRDLNSMEQLAAEGPSDWRYEAIGRGWPPVAGWTVTDRFVNEKEFDALVESSSAIIIPYKRFFQSGVAMRSLELATPVIGPARSSLRPLLGDKYPWLVADSRWLPAIESALSADSDDLLRLAKDIYRHVQSEWTGWLAHR